MAASDRPVIVPGPDHSPAVDALVATSDTARAGGVHPLEALRADLPHRLHRTWVPHLLGRRVRCARGWSAPDRRTARWWPQGVAGVDGLLVVAWYAKDGGVRLSFVDLERGRYRHVLLALPGDDATPTRAPTLRPVRAHAGGLAHAGDWLHVAATRRGCLSARVDDLVRLREPVPGSDGHRWVLPVRRELRGELEGAASPPAAGETDRRLRWSFLATEPGGMIVGEYGRGDASTRIARFALDADGLPAGLPRARPDWVVESGVRGMQGVARHGGSLVADVSHGGWVPGSLVALPTGPDGAPLPAPAHGGGATLRPGALPMGPEDLTDLPRRGRERLWTATEHPRRRWIVGFAP